MYLCCGGVGGEWVGGLDQIQEGCVISVPIVSSDSLYRWQVQGYPRILGVPSVQLVAPYGYLLPTVYLFMADIANPDFSVIVGLGFGSTPPAFMSSSASHPMGPHVQLLPKR